MALSGGFGNDRRRGRGSDEGLQEPGGRVSAIPGGRPSRSNRGGKPGFVLGFVPHRGREADEPQQE